MRLQETKRSPATPARAVFSTSLVIRNVTTISGRTSMRLEPETWAGLSEICRRDDVTLDALVRRIEAGCAPGGRTSAVRIHVLQYFRNAATDEGHLAAGHGPRRQHCAVSPGGLGPRTVP